MAIAKANASMGRGRGTVLREVISPEQNQADDNGTWCENGSS